MVNVKLFIPMYAEVGLILYSDGNVPVSGIDVEDGSLCTRRSSRKGEKTLSKGGPFAREIGGINFRINGRASGIVTRKGKILNNPKV